MRNAVKFGAVAALMLAGFANAAEPVSDAEIVALMKASFKERGIAKMDRLEQSDLQKQCSTWSGKELPQEVKASLEKAAMDSIVYPADGKYLGDWKEGEKIAQSGRGLQFNDTEKTVAGGNCYACHELSKAEIAFGTIGPSLHNYGKLRGGATEQVLRYTWGRLWNSHAYAACNHMPRFGAAGILTDEQLKDVMALLLDPESPVNQ
ncbi:MAG TPA: sulfur oxidation c-type cytochrome SoxX [Burkholderiaceae bacterium]|nr:sulfur oxidation c-type cytochrome SoxX [Burkholderiaceae bacterium]